MKQSLISLITLSFLLFSCKQYTTSPNLEANEKQPPSTIAMAKELAHLSASLLPQESTFQNLKRAQMFFAESEKTPAPQNLMVKLRSGYEYMNSNENERAEEIFNSIYNEIQSLNIPNKNEFVFKVLGLRALNHFRKGELANCLHNHNEASCIMPFVHESYHTQKDGSTGAVQDILELLKIKKDPNYIWLLNVAYMTLGQYPYNVPKEYLVPITPKETPNLVNAFTNIGSSLGIDDYQLSGGVIVDDFTGNGYYDIISSSWDLQDQIVFYINNGDGTFTENHEAAGLKGITGGLNITHTDYNNDGHLDFLILRGAWLPVGKYPNSLMKNNGDGTFTDVTKESGIYSLHPTLAASWADFNNDGLLDLFIANESFSKSNENHPCELFMNQGDGTFKDIASLVGADKVGILKGATIGDIDNDLDQDIYITNLLGNNYLLRNDAAQNEFGFTLTDISVASKTQGAEQSFPCWFYDYDNDGKLDIFSGGFSTRFYGNLPFQYLKELKGEGSEADPPRLYRNLGDGSFKDMTDPLGLNKACFIMGAGYGDMNNDGYLDMYFGTGEPDLKSVIPNRAFLNLQGKEYAEVTTQARLGHLQKGHGISFADIDFDGDQDIYAVMGGAYTGDVFFNALFENPGNNNNWLKVKLEGSRSNRVAIGARLELKVKGPEGTRSIHRHVSNGSSFGENPFTVEFGFLGIENIQELKIIWPSGIKQTFDNIEGNNYFLIKEGSTGTTKLNRPSFKFQFKDHQHHLHS